MEEGVYHFVQDGNFLKISFLTWGSVQKGLRWTELTEMGITRQKIANGVQQKNNKGILEIQPLSHTKELQKCLSEWSDLLGVNKATLLYRIKNWPIDDALSPIPRHARPRSPDKIKTFQPPVVF